MEKPTDEQINKRIAEFMDVIYFEDSKMLDAGRVGSSIDPSAYYLRDPYTKSMDALIPVVGKIMLKEKDHGWVDFEFTPKTWEGDMIYIVYSYDKKINVCEKSPSRALALAIYKVLEE